MQHFFGDEMIDLYSMHHLPRQRRTIGCDDRLVVLARLPRWKARRLL
jgi:hypothetical protein